MHLLSDDSSTSLSRPACLPPPSAQDAVANAEAHEEEATGGDGRDERDALRKRALRAEVIERPKLVGSHTSRCAPLMEREVRIPRPAQLRAVAIEQAELERRAEVACGVGGRDSHGRPRFAAGLSRPSGTEARSGRRSAAPTISRPP